MAAPTVPSRVPAWKVASAFAAIYLIWGSTYLAIKIAIETIPPFLHAAMRFGISGGLLYVWARRRGAERPSARHWLSAAGVGTLLLLGGNGFVAWSEQRIQTGLAALIIATVPFWMTLLGALWRREAVPVRVWVGLTIGFGGIAWLVRPTLGQPDFAGIAVLFTAAFLWSVGSLGIKAAPLPQSPVLSTGMQMLCGSAALTAAGGLTGEFGLFRPAGISAASLAAVAYLVVFGSLIGFTAYGWLLRVSTLSRVSTYAFVNPVVAVILGSLFAGEKISAQILVAGALILTGVALVIWTPQFKKPGE